MEAALRIDRDEIGIALQIVHGETGNALWMGHDEAARYGIFSDPEHKYLLHAYSGVTMNDHAACRNETFSDPGHSCRHPYSGETMNDPGDDYNDLGLWVLG